MSKDLADTLRAAIKQSRLSLLELSHATGVGIGTLSEFMAGADMRLKTASKVARFLGLELKRTRAR